MDTKKKGISGSTLKLIAAATMLTDHIGAVILERFLANAGLNDVLNTAMSFVSKGQFDAAGAIFTEWGAYYYWIAIIYLIMRLVIGRIAFPIFCFTLVEGFAHTRSRVKYALTMLIFAVITEVPFDLAIKGRFLDLGYQNVMWTLLIGLLTIWLLETVNAQFEEMQAKRVLIVLANCGIIAVGSIGAEFLHTDYGFIGILAIATIYLIKKSNVARTAWSCFVLSVGTFTELATFLCLIPISFYNGERGLKMKYFFYIFYPAHLLILYLIARAMGLV